MNPAIHWLKTLSELDIAAIAYAVLLSFACLARGAVYDVLVAILLLASIPILFLASRDTRTVHIPLRNIGIVLLLCLICVLFLQQRIVPTGSDAYIWHQVHQLTGQDVRAVAFYDKAAWFQGIGRFLLLIFAFIIALFIGSSESSARFFLQGLVVSGTLFLAATFFIKTEITFCQILLINLAN